MLTQGMLRNQWDWERTAYGSAVDSTDASYGPCAKGATVFICGIGSAIRRRNTR